MKSWWWFLFLFIGLVVVIMSGGAALLLRWEGSFAAGVISKEVFEEELLASPRSVSKQKEAPLASESYDSKIYFKQIAQRWNRFLGIPLRKDRDLWKELGGSVAQRLKLPCMAQTKEMSVYSLERNLPFILGVQPRQILLYTNARRRLEEIWIIFANRGSLRPMEFSQKLHEDEMVVQRNLEALFGFAPTKKVRQPSGVSERVKEWKKEGSQIKFYHKENDFVAVVFRPDALGASKASKKEGETKKSVLQLARGDTIIGDIPLIPQGRKPYCVPVTVERMLRYLGVPCNMFALAAAGKVDHQGCHSFDIFDQMNRTLQSQGLGLRVVEGGFQSIEKSVRSSIDQGFPIIWLVKGYVSTFCKAKERTGSRNTARNNAVWKLELASSANETKLDPGQYHSVLINGYNPTSREISVIDELGHLWITEKEAHRINAKWMFVVQKER